MNSALHRPDRATATPAHTPAIVRVTGNPTLTSVESALTQPLILKDFKSPEMNTYKNRTVGYPVRRADVVLVSAPPTEHGSRTIGHNIP
jgi:hypothetical protein